MSKDLLVQPVSGFTAQVGSLISMMEVTRSTTKERVLGLNTDQLDWRFDQDANSIGMLLGHIAAVEEIYTIGHLEDRQLTVEEDSRLQPRLELGNAGFLAMRGTKLDLYIAELDRVRANTIERMRELDDEKLNAIQNQWGKRVNLHWMFFHVMEDELRHTGQITWLLKRMPSNI
jgi:uncharacterized damage-inducible protein DinB